MGWVSGARRAALGAAAALGALAVAAAGQDRPASTGRADYRIEARLEGDTKRLAGVETLRWTNLSGEATSELWFHLYLNAFSNNRSTHLVEAKGELRGHEMTEGWGWIRVTAIRARDPGDGGWVDLMPTFRYRRPDDANEEDRTVFSVELPAEAESGTTVEVEVEWESQLPRVRRRTGYKGDFLLVSQWFPKLGVYEAGRGWVCHQFHMNSEFYADFGTYDVTLDLPARYEGKVFGSGRKENEVRQGDRVVARFVAPSTRDQRRVDLTGGSPLVHDFAWTADPDYRVFTQTFRFAQWEERYPEAVAEVEATLGRDVVLRDVDVTVLVQPERADQAARHYEATCAALFFYGIWYGEYPYEHVTVIDPAWGGRAAGGMEYPTLFTCGTSLFTTEDMYVPESVTVHEAGHQFWYGLVGNNEFEAAWLDEGFNSYADSEVLWRVYGPRRHTTRYAAVPVEGVPLAPLAPEGALAEALALRRFPLPFDLEATPLPASGFLDRWRDQPRLTFAPQWSDPREEDRSGYLRDPDTDPIDTWSWRYADRGSYRANSYPRTAVALRTLRALVGEEAFLRGLRHYAEAWRYRHPYPDDFFRAFQQGAGVDVRRELDQLFRSTATADWSVAVDQRRRPERRGFFQGEGGQFLELAVDPAADEVEPPWQVEVVLRRDGALSLPIPLRLTFEDGSTREEVWTAAEQRERAWKRIELESEVELVAAELDPHRALPIDADRSNDRWYAAEDRTTPWRWGERVLSHLQHALHFVGGIGG